MPVSAARRRANQKHDKANFEYCSVKVRIGKKDNYKAHASSRGESLNGFISRAIEEQIKRDTAAATD